MNGTAVVRGRQRPVAVTRPVAAIGTPPRRSDTATAPVVLVLFVLMIIPPSYFYLGELRLSFPRLFLLIAFVPLFVRLVTGAAGRIRDIDILFMAFSFWMALTLVYHHGFARLPLAGITVVETFGGYLVGRTLVRNAADFRLLFRGLFWVLVVLSPFVAVELLTDRNILQELSRHVMPTYFKPSSSYGRVGLYRVMAGFEHPILYGLVCSVVFAPLLALHRGGHMSRLVLTLFVGIMTFAALSSAPLLALVIQIGLMAWGRITHGRWWLLIGLIASAYVTVDMLSNRTPVTILINYITFDPNTAWTRVLTWEYGSAEMWRHPIFGIGLNDWLRPYWLTESIDNFWLLNGMRHGVVGVILLIAALGTGLWRVSYAPDLSAELSRWRRGYVLALVALFFTLCTVHVWGGTMSLVMALIGAGMWFCEGPQDAHSPETDESKKTALQPVTSRFSRFPPNPGAPIRSGKMSEYRRPLGTIDN